MALAFPLFTQTIIDKVIVHRTESTLIALAAGMGVFVLFTAALTWVRQYLVLHTGNRVDAVLGSHVFEHLFRLPPLYFQHRPTGVIAARMQGIETIREFVSSAAVMLMLDVPFLFIFVAVMFWYSASLTWIVLGILCLIVAASLRSKRANPAGARAWCFGPSLFCSAC
jgi:subfamily B ATP-binding cassette protein HlyB/CyaB